MKQKDKKIVLDRNKDYFTSFVQTRGSLSKLGMAICGIFLSVVYLFQGYTLATRIYFINLWESKLIIFWFWVTIFMAFCLILYCTKSILYKFQVFSSIMLIIVIVLVTFELLYTCYLLSVYTANNFNWGSPLANIFVILMGGTYLGSFIYNVFWLRKQLAAGFSEERTRKNYLASKIYEPKSLCIIYGCTVLGRSMARATGRIFGFAAGLLFVVAFSRLHIELLYAAYLRMKDKAYWEIDPVPVIKEPRDKRLIWIKWLKAVNVLICVGIICWIRKSTGYQNMSTLQLWLGRIAYLDLFAVIIVWIIKKIRGIGKGKL